MFSPETRRLLDEEKNFESKPYVELLKRRRAELEEELHALGVRQNSHSLPNRLPAEVLEKIFKDDAAYVRQDWEEDNALLWVRLAQVCRHWREVAHNYGPLWTNVVLSNPEFMKVMLARSKGIPISFSFHTDQLSHYRRINKVWTVCEFLTGMLSQAERFRSLSLRIYRNSKTSLEELLSKASGSAPALLDLSLAGSDFGREPIPSDFLEGGLGAPALQRLQLERTFIAWDRIPLPITLTHLTLREGAPRPLGSLFYESLSRLVSLQGLVLGGWLPVSRGPPTVRPSYPIALPSLTSLTVEDFAEDIAYFFASIRTPKVTYLRLTISDRLPQGSFIDQCLARARSAIGQDMVNFQDIGMLLVRDFDELGQTSSTKPSIQVWYIPQEQASNDTTGDRPHPTAITLEFTHQPLPLSDIFASVTNRFDLASTQSLEIARCRDIPPELLLETFCQLPNVEHLTIASTPVHTFFEEMGRDPAKEGGEDTPEPYFPALRSATLASIDFDYGAVPREDAIVSICSALNQRPATHFVKEVRLERCINFGSEDFELFRELANPTIGIYWSGGDAGSNGEGGQTDG